MGADFTTTADILEPDDGLDRSTLLTQKTAPQTAAAYHLIETALPMAVLLVLFRIMCVVASISLVI